MDFVDVHRPRVEITALALFDPGLVLPLMPIGTADHRRGVRRTLGSEGVGISLQQREVAAVRLDLVFVAVALAESGNEQLPDAGAGMEPHRMPPAVPVIEVADD